jgi:bla regulator protein BlaR1
METLYSYAQPFFEWLLRSTVQASMVICLILLIQALLRNRLTARWHYALWLILVVRMILPWAPQSRCSIFNLAAWEAGSKVPTHVMSEPDAELTEAVGDSSATTVYQEQSMNEDGTAVPAASDVSSRPLTAEPELTSSTEGQDRNFTAPIRISQESADPATHTAFRLFSVLPFLWLAGALLLGGYIIICNLRLLRAAGVECPSTDKEMLELLEECRSEIGLRTIVALVPSEKVNTPILIWNDLCQL